MHKKNNLPAAAVRRDKIMPMKTIIKKEIVMPHNFKILETTDLFMDPEEK